eukprot:5840898-Prorocentrum_lima.AAC.1
MCIRDRFQRAKHEQATEAHKGMEMFVSRVLEQKWQEWIASKEPGTPTMNQPTLEASVARALD